MKHYQSEPTTRLEYSNLRCETPLGFSFFCGIGVVLETLYLTLHHGQHFRDLLYVRSGHLRHGKYDCTGSLMQRRVMIKIFLFVSAIH